MTAVALVLVATGIVTGIAAVAGAGLFSLIILPIGIGVAIWLGLTAKTGRTPRDVAGEAPNPELLGPGGPDDPTR